MRPSSARSVRRSTTWPAACAATATACRSRCARPSGCSPACCRGRVRRRCARAGRTNRRPSPMSPSPSSTSSASMRLRPAARPRAPRSRCSPISSRPSTRPPRSTASRRSAPSARRTSRLRAYRSNAPITRRAWCRSRVRWCASCSASTPSAASASSRRSASTPVLSRAASSAAAASSTTCGATPCVSRAASSPTARPPSR